MKFCYIDFEYRKVTEEKLDLVSCAWITNTGYKGKKWLFRDSLDREILLADLLTMRDEGYIFVAYAVTAEASSFLSMNLDPLKCKWIDLYLEYRCLTNHNDNFMYGKQLLNGRKKVTKRPPNKYEMTEEQRAKASYSKPEHNLAAACYKVLGEEIDLGFKDDTRNIIINGTDEEVLAAKDQILEYNEEDIHYLQKLHQGLNNEYKRLLKRHPREFDKLLGEQLLRGDYAARTAVMERRGYPIDYQRTFNFSRNVNDILWSLQHEINKLHPTILPFTQNRDYTYSWSHVRTREWIDSLPSHIKKSWLRTEKGAYSLSADAFKEHFNFRHEYPKDNFGAQMVRFLNTKRNLNGFLQSKTAKKKGTFWDYVGSDHRVRPYFGIYGSQSARSQPKATGFLFLKSAWMRALCVPEKGTAIAGIDYKSQEFLIAALLFNDMNMVNAYASGDVYLYLAKLAGRVPWDGKREDYEEIRNIFKIVTLGIMFGMGPFLLAQELTQKTGKEYTKHQAEALINTFNRAYRDHYRGKETMYRQYKRQGFLKIPCGWTLWGDNSNEKSVKNFPVQGRGSTIMRKAVSLAQDAGLDVIFTLHDAIYIQYAIGNESEINTLAQCMKDAFRTIWDEDLQEYADVKLDINCWSPDYTDGYFDSLYGKVKRQSLYVDGRSIEEYKKFSEYFEYEEFNL